MAQQKYSVACAIVVITGMAGFSYPVHAQGWYGGSYYGYQAPWTAPRQGYYRPPYGNAVPAPGTGSAKERDAIQAQLATSQQQLRDTRNELQRTQMLLQQARSALQREQSATHQRSSMQHTFSNQLTHISSQQDAVYAQMKQLTDEVSELKFPLIDNQAQIANIAAITRTLDEERGRLQSSIDRQDERLATLLAEIQMARDALEQTRSDAATIREKMSTSELQSQSCETRLSDMNNKIQDIIFDSDTSRQALNNALTARDNLQAELSTCTAKLAQVKAARKARYAAPPGNSASSATEPQTESVAIMTAEAVTNSDLDSDGVPNDADFCPETPAGITVGPTGCDLPLPIILKGVNFRVDSNQLNEASHAILDSVAETLARYPGLKVEIADFTHTQGNPASNRNLSQQRAETIKRNLIRRGISADRLAAHGYGDTRPASGSKQPERILPGQPVTLRQID